MLSEDQLKHIKEMYAHYQQCHEEEDFDGEAQYERDMMRFWVGPLLEEIDRLKNEIKTQLEN